MIHLVTFGDSWPDGAELNQNEKPYGYQLADLLQTPSYKNYAQSNTSNDHLILQLEKYLEENNVEQNTIAVFFITGISRLCLIDYNNNANCITPWAGKERGDMAYYYFKYFHTPAQELFRLRLSILALQKICSSYNIKDRYILGWDKPDLDFPGIDLDKFYDRGNTNCADLFEANGSDEFTNAKNNVYVYPNDCHPNYLGHQLIAENLYKWIKHAKD